MAVSVCGIGVASPAATIRQDEAADVAGTCCGVDARGQRLIHQLFRRAAVQQRGTALAEPGRSVTGDLQAFYNGHSPSTSQRMARYMQLAPDLAADAARDALAEAGWCGADVTHLITVTCTGFFSPGVDIALIRTLQLPSHVKRVQIGFMGCHAALNAIQTAAAMAEADQDARVLVVCVELCSLHFQYQYDPQQLVATSLFADGAGALAMRGSHGRDTLRLLSTASQVLEDSESAMTWRIGDEGFVMTLSARVPQLVGEVVGPWIGRLLGEHGMTARDVAGWAIHPGGPRILSAVGEALGLTDQQLEPSRGVLWDHGNMSSPTVLFILDRLRRLARSGPIVLMSFGPGLTAEAALLSYTCDHASP